MAIWTQTSSYTPVVGVSVLAPLSVGGLLGGGWFDMAGGKYYVDLLGRIGSNAGTANPWANAYLARAATEAAANYESRIKVTYQFALARPVYAASRLLSPAANASAFLCAIDNTGYLQIYTCLNGVLSSIYKSSTKLTLAEATSVYLVFDTEQLTYAATRLTATLYLTSNNTVLLTGTVTSSTSSLQLVKGTSAVLIYNSSATAGLITSLQTYSSDAAVKIANVAPVANADSYTVSRRTVLTASTVLSNDTDANGDALTAILVTSPANGTLTFNANGTFSYQANVGFAGVDTFTYKVSDGTLTSAAATVSITVTNAAPVANADTYSVSARTVLVGSTVLANDTDANGDALTASLVAAPTKGAFTFNTNGTFTYQANAGFVGADSFTYRANDGTVNSNLATVTINVTNNPPVAADDAYTVNASGAYTSSVSVLSNDTDANGDPLTVSLTIGTTHGALTLNPNGTFTYTPGNGYRGFDSFTYTVNDGKINGNTATVSLTVPNTAPVATDDFYTVKPNKSYSGATVLANDSDYNQDTLSAVLVQTTTHGTLTFAPDGTFIYAPFTGYSGPDSFTYQVSDGDAVSGVATVYITVEPIPNAAPVAGNANYVTAYNTQLIVTDLVDHYSDEDGDVLTAQVMSGVANGTLVFHSNGNFEYTPNNNYSGNDSFMYAVSDGKVSSNMGIVSIHIAQAPVVVPPVIVVPPTDTPPTDTPPTDTPPTDTPPTDTPPADTPPTDTPPTDTPPTDTPPADTPPTDTPAPSTSTPYLPPLTPPGPTSVAAPTSPEADTAKPAADATEQTRRRKVRARSMSRLLTQTMKGLSKWGLTDL